MPKDGLKRSKPFRVKLHNKQNTAIKFTSIKVWAYKDLWPNIRPEHRPTTLETRGQSHPQNPYKNKYKTYKHLHETYTNYIKLITTYIKHIKTHIKHINTYIKHVKTHIKLTKPYINRYIYIYIYIYIHIYIYIYIYIQYICNPILAAQNTRSD